MRIITCTRRIAAYLCWPISNRQVIAALSARIADTTLWWVKEDQDFVSCPRARHHNIDRPVAKCWQYRTRTLYSQYSQRSCLSVVRCNSNISPSWIGDISSSHVCNLHRWMDLSTKHPIRCIIRFYQKRARSRVKGSRRFWCKLRSIKSATAALAHSSIASSTSANMSDSIANAEFAVAWVRFICYFKFY